MRILHCIPTMAGGGAERQFCYLVDGLRRRGHEVHVALMREGANMQRLCSSEVPIHWLTDCPPFRLTTLLEVCEVIKRTDVDLVQSWLARMDIWAGIAAHVTRRPWVYTEQANPKFGSGLRSAVLRRIRGTADAWATNSDVATDYWKSFVPRRSRHAVTIDSAVPISEIQSVQPIPRSALGLPDNAEIVLFTGRFTVEKGIDLLAEILIAFVAQRPGAVAAVCGEGPLFPHFMAEITRRGAKDRCFSLGYRQDIWAVMKSVDVCLSTSNSEGRPNVLLEAIACGTPIVITDIPAHRDFLDDETALIFDNNDAAAGVRALISALDDTAATQKRVDTAARRIERFSVEAMTEAFEALYQDLLHG